MKKMTSIFSDNQGKIRIELDTGIPNQEFELSLEMKDSINVSEPSISPYFTPEDKAKKQLKDLKSHLNEELRISEIEPTSSIEELDKALEEILGKYGA